MKDTFVIGFAGPGGAGKDTVARLLGFYSIAFAEPLKEGLLAMGFPEPKNRELKEEIIAGYTFTWRKAAQTLGTEWGRMLDPEIWLSIAKQRRVISPLPVISVTDVRFHNEADWVREHGMLVHVMGRNTSVKPEHVGHASEHGLWHHAADWLLDNSGDMDQLSRSVDLLRAAVIQRISGGSNAQV